MRTLLRLKAARDLTQEKIFRAVQARGLSPAPGWPDRHASRAHSRDQWLDRGALELLVLG